MDTKQGYALKNWVEGLSDEAYYPWKWPKKKKSTKIGQPYICQRIKESFDSSIKGNLWVFQNHTKQAKIKVVFNCFLWFWKTHKLPFINESKLSFVCWQM